MYPTILRQTIASKLKQNYQTYRFNNPRTNALASGVTLTLLSAQPVDLGKSYPVASLPTATHMTGGTPYFISGIAWAFPVTTCTYGGTNGNLGNGTNGVAWRLKVNVDSDSICFQVVGTSAPYGYRVVVDGKYVSTTPLVASNSGFSNYIRVDFGTPPAGRAKHEVWLEGDQGTYISGIFISPNGSMQPAPYGLKATVLGDSVTAGYISPTTGLTLLPAINDNFATVLGDAFGISDLRSSGSAGQGFVAPAGSGGYTLVQRVPYDVTGDEDVIFVPMLYNDQAQTQSLVASAVTSTLQTIRSKNPTALIVVFGNACNPSISITYALNTEALVLSGYTAWNDLNSIYVPVSNPQSGQPMLFGIGYLGHACSGTLTFTAPLVSATSATLSTAFTGPTNSYYLNFSDNVTQKVVTLTNGSTAVSWTGAVTASATATYYNGSTSGNTDILVGIDGLHPANYYAHQVMGFWMADCVYNLLNTFN